METKSKARPASNTMMFPSIFLSVAVCFVALIHVEIELHAHRQMLQVLNQQIQENRGPRNAEHEETVDAVLKMLRSDSRGKGEWLKAIATRSEQSRCMDSLVANCVVQPSHFCCENFEYIL